MQDVASVLTDRFSGVLERLPAGLDLDVLALEAKAIQRRREVVDGAALLRIARARRAFVTPDCGLGLHAGDRSYAGNWVTS